ncbi:MAG: response regulator [Halanaerobiales bacterium]
MSKGKKILIIDDEKNIRFTLKKSLENDYNIVTAVNGEDGIEKFSNEDFDLVLLDMKLPGVNGIDTLKQIKEEDQKANIVIITGFGSVDSAVETMKLGAIDYLNKPFTPEEIKEIVNEVISREQLELKEDELESYDDYLKFAKSCINNQELEKGYEYLQEAVSLDTSKPEAFNLLGVILEYKNKPLKAQKQYRAALALDPSYKPAQENLERTSQFDYSKRDIKLDDEEDNDKEN